MAALISGCGAIAFTSSYQWRIIYPLSYFSSTPMTDLIRRTLPRACRGALLAVAAIAVVGCKDVAPNTAGPADVGGTFVVAVPGDANTMLPTLAMTSIDRELTDLLYDRLAEIGQDLNTVGDKGFKPQLAERWEWSSDSLSISFFINPHAKWHDGQPVRASDVKFTVGLIKDAATGAPMQQLITNVDSVSIRDSLTPVVWFKQRTPEQFYELTYQVLIVPQHILGNTPAGQLKTAEVARHGIGSGRFRLARWDAGQRIVLVADTINYRKRPRLDRIVFSLVPDWTTASTKFFAGEADMYEQVRPEQLAKFVGDPLRRIIRYPNLQYAYFAFNLMDPTHPGQANPLFGERAVRRALTMAVDRRAMLRNVFDTLGQIAYGPFPHTLGVADTTLPMIAYDTTKARALLDSAGWVTGAGGVRARNGRRLDFSIVIPNSSAQRKAYAVLLQDAFRRVGAAARVDESDFGSFASKQGSHTFDAAIIVYGTDPDVSGLKQSWGTAGIAKDGTNFSSYSNPAVDALLDSATTSFDPARTRSYARRAFESIMEDAPGIWLYEPISTSGLHTRIKTTPSRADGFWSGIAEWWIPPAERIERDKIGLRAAP